MRVTVPDAAGALTEFFFWTSWAATTERPGRAVTYTNNWPHEPLVGNRPTGANVVWSLASVGLLLAAVGAILWWRAFRGREEAAGARGRSWGIVATP
jgi:nitric oxide reductase subunit B